MDANPLNAQQLAAENERLKRLINRFGSSSPIGTHVLSDNFNGDVNSFLTLWHTFIMGKSAPDVSLLEGALTRLSVFLDVEFAGLIIDQFGEIPGVWLEWNGARQIAFSNPKPQNVFKPIFDNLVDSCDWFDGYVFFPHREPGPESIKFWVNEHPNLMSVFILPLVGDGVSGLLLFGESCFERQWQYWERYQVALAAGMLAPVLSSLNYHFGLNAVTKAADFLNRAADLITQYSAVDEQLPRILEHTGNFFGVSTLSMVENVADETCLIRFEWKAGDARVVQRSGQRLSYHTDFPGWKELLVRQSVLGCSSVDSVQLLLWTEGIPVERLIIPVHSCERLWGFLMLDTVHEPRCWSKSDVKTLQTLVGFLPAFFEKQQLVNQLVNANQESVRINAALQEKEQFLHNILSVVPASVILVRNHQVLFMNNHVMTASGYSEQDIIGKETYPFFYPDAHDSALVDQFYHDINTLGTGKMEVTFVGKNNNPLTFQVVGMRCPLGGMDDTYLLIGQDVTFLNQTLYQLNESEERYRKMLEASVEGVFILESPDSISYVNQAACELLGYSSDELMTLSPASFLAERDDVVGYYNACEVIKGGQGYGRDVVVVTRSGKRIDAALYGTSIVLKGKQVFYFSIRNISVRKQQEAAIQQSEQKFRTLTENISDQIIRLGLDGELIYVNQAFEHAYHVADKQETGLLWNLNSFPEEFAHCIKKSLSDAYANKSTCITESITKLGEKDFAVEWTISPEYDNQEQIISVLCIGRDVTLQHKARKELLEAKEKAESADKLKSAFLANLSHEIRTPLNAIVGFSSLLKDVNIEEREKLEYIEIINRSSDNLMTLINDIMDIAKIVSGELTISKTVFRVNDLLREMQLAVQRNLRSDRGVSPDDILLELPKLNYEPVIETDPARLNQVMMNLLGNAVKFSNQGSVSFGYRLHNGLFRFFVKDSGIGISEEKLQVIFDPFRQGEESISKRYGGTGLGLSISKRLVELLGGGLMVESQSGSGSEFYFDIPDVASPAAEVNLMVKRENRYAERHQVNYHWPDRLVLLVDDNSYVHLQLRKFFENTGLTLISARTGASARELLRNRKDIDLVLLDVQMFESNDFDFVKQLKAIRSDIPMIAQTALTLSGDRERALAAGFDEYVPKPISRELLLEKLNVFLSVSKGIQTW